jgi:hypothetical protein
LIFFPINTNNFLFNNSICAGGNSILAKPEYWRKNKESEIILLCENLRANCVGENNETSLMCFEGHIGALCESCDTTGKIWGKVYA